MLVRILKKNFGGTEFAPEVRVLHLGGVGSTNVDRLEFDLPDEWLDKSITLHVKRLDGSQPVPVLLDDAASAAVGKEFTEAKSGLWMLQALGEDGYCAFTRPARYDCYETLRTDGADEISQSQYESFVAQVMGYASAAQQHAKNAEAAAAQAGSCRDSASNAQANAWNSASNAAASADTAAAGANRAEAAAKRAEALAPADGSVVSVNGKGGAVDLTAEDVGAVPARSSGYVRSVQLQGRTLTLTLGDGSTQTYETQDSTDLAGMTGVLDVNHGGTGKSTPLTAADVGALAAGGSGYLQALGVENNQMTITLGDGSQKQFALAAPYTLPTATEHLLGGVKAGSNLTVAEDGTLTANITAGTGDLTDGSSPLAAGAVYLVYGTASTQTAQRTEEEP